MSLFTTREWWSTKIDSAEEFDKGCMCVANIDNEEARKGGGSGGGGGGGASSSASSSREEEAKEVKEAGLGAHCKIVTGSFSGLLRIYYPRQQAYRIEDLMIEQNLGMPILQVAAGRFVSGSDQLALAVLHPRRLAVYMVGAMGGQGSAASYYSMVKAYEHHARRGRGALPRRSTFAAARSATTPAAARGGTLSACRAWTGSCSFSSRTTRLSCTASTRCSSRGPSATRRSSTRFSWRRRI